MNLKRAVIVLFFLKTTECSKNKMEGYIVGGEYASIDQFPHAVFLSVECEESWICGSSILNQRVLLTAAHCIFGCLHLKGFDIDAYAGNSNLVKVTVIRKAQRIVVHKYFNENTVENDVALAMLKRAFPLGSHIKRVIVSPSFPSHVDVARIAGWGIVNDKTGESTVKLKSVNQKLRARATCARVVRMKPGMMCAGDFSRNNRPTEGDSGSALMSAQFQQIGLVSFRTDETPGVVFYTNVSYYYDWVRKTAKLLYCA